jgi:hypothetical protein
MVRDAVKQASAFDDQARELREVLRDIADERGEINRRKLGWWIGGMPAASSMACALCAPAAIAPRKPGRWEVASLFGVHKNTVREWVKRGLPTNDDRRPMLILEPRPG